MTDQVKSVILVASGILVGASATYLLTKNHFEEKYKAYAEEEIASVKEVFHVEQEAEREEEERGERIRQYVTRDTSDDEVDIEFVHIKRKTVGDLLEEDIQAHNRQGSPDMAEFDISAAGGDGDTEDDVQDLDISKEERSGDFPYVISAEEFFTEGETNDKICLAYYKEDNTLSDDAQGVVDDVEEKIGTANLLRFGHGSQDANIVYVRNEKLEADFEICREEGSYKKLVLGIDDWENLVIPVDKAYAMAHKNARNRE